MKYKAIHTFTSPSFQFNNMQAQLATLAAYAKAANETDLFNKLKEMHDDMSRRFNTENTPKKKSWFSAHFGYDSETLFTAPLIENNVAFKMTYEIASKMSIEEKRNALYTHLNSVFGGQIRKHRYVNDNLDDYTDEDIEEMSRNL